MGVVAVLLSGHVLGQLALVPMIIVCPVAMPVVQKVEVVVVGHRDVAAAFLVLVWVCLVLLVGHGRHRSPDLSRVAATRQTVACVSSYVFMD